MQKLKDFQIERNIQGIDIILPTPPDYKDIMGAHTKYAPKQYFIPPDPKTITEINYKMVNEERLTLEEEKFIEREWDRRINGLFFYNNGNLEYLTGNHYMYVAYWKIPVVVKGMKRLGLPSWIDSDRDYWHIWDSVVKHDRCYGLYYITNRRDGKTFKGDCTLYNDITQAPESSGGIQSKTNADAKAVFNKLVKSWQMLPEYFKPVDVGETHPSSALKFYEPSKRGAKNKHKTYQQVLRSEINFENVKEEAYDGWGLYRYLMDEAGKCHTKGTEIKMFDGSIKKVEDIVSGDFLMGDDSKPREVMSLARGQEQLYEIVPKKGDSWGCNESHILSLKVSSNHIFKGYKKNDTINISVKEYLELSSAKKKHLMLWRVGVEYKEVKHQLEPYMIGLWLGDGSSRNSQISNVDEEIIDYMGDFCCRNDLQFFTSDGVIHNLSSATRKKGSNIILKSLQDNNLLLNKHIPKEYLIDSQNNRLQLLAGLIDSDGYLSKKGKDKKPSYYEITQKREVLARDIQELASSLGFYASINSKEAKMKREDGSIYSSIVWRVFIYGDLWRIPCKVYRKQAKKSIFNNNRRNPLRCGFKVVKKGVGDYYGFTISGNHLYLLKDYTVTHNTIDADVNARWHIVKECLADGTTITGKGIVTTTVEEMERKGGKNAKVLWDDSNQNDKNELGMTISGLWRYFKPADYGLRGTDEKGVPFVDKFGYSDKERARAYLEKRRAGLKGEALSSEKRKYPLHIDDAFMVNASDSVFDVDRIYAQKKFNEENLNEPVRGNFVWAGGQQDTVVNWHPDPNGRWRVSHHPKQEDRNKYTMGGGQRVPTGTTIVAGCDPFDHRTTTDNKKSDAASYCLKKFDPWSTVNSNCFISEYINRPATPELFYEDMIMQMVYFSGLLLVENNKPGIINYFRQRGYYGYLMKRPEETLTKSSSRQQEVGIPMSGDAARDALVNGLVSYVYDNIGYNPESDTFGNCPFEKLLDDWLNFDVNKWTDYDATVASGLAVLASKKPVFQTKDVTFLKDLHPRFDNTGNRSKRVN